MDKNIKRTLIIIFSTLLLFSFDITITKDDKYTKINNMYSVLLMKKPMFEKGINGTE